MLFSRTCRKKSIKSIIKTVRLSANPRPELTGGRRNPTRIIRSDTSIQSLTLKALPLNWRATNIELSTLFACARCSAIAIYFLRIAADPSRHIQQFWPFRSINGGNCNSTTNKRDSMWLTTLMNGNSIDVLKDWIKSSNLRLHPSTSLIFRDLLPNLGKKCTSW